MEINEVYSNGATKEQDKIIQPITKKPGRLNDNSNRSLMGEMFKSDMKEVGEYILWDVLVKAIKDVIIDVSHSAIDAVFGDGRRRPSSSYGGTRGSYRSSIDYTDYNRRSSDPRDRSSFGRDSSIYSDPIVDSRGEAEDIMATARDILDKYDFLKVGDLYELCGISTRPQHFKYGWSNIATYNIRRIRDGWLIEMPKIEPYN